MPKVLYHVSSFIHSHTHSRWGLPCKAPIYRSGAMRGPVSCSRTSIGEVQTSDPSVTGHSNHRAMLPSFSSAIIIVIILQPFWMFSAPKIHLSERWSANRHRYVIWLRHTAGICKPWAGAASDMQSNLQHACHCLNCTSDYTSCREHLRI